ncbi:VWA domain-containing protein [Aquicoccus sp. G2-2]|uniref:vWA domain-containing protein n=1 Tax=Aquicoccus sp. G2-2 TaxID=3092120 RepID=UPI002ADFA035|nr:VWA domain-containing protein [Aquicoccus sp. G2-2]MEA1113305.1 VWA domain-containing protein [Aquicoccus sp. G2-2]
MTLALAVPVAAQERAMIVLDASGSMWGQIDGKTKIEIARETLGDVLKAVPADEELGLMVYGHRRKGDCKDIELAVPASKGTAGKIAAFANQISPKGKTPLSAAVKQAAQALRFTEDKATVILVTDGLETCEMDPCALGRELEKAGVNFTTHVVGFGLSKEEGAKVACLAKETGGEYMQAGSAAALSEALAKTVVAKAAPEPEPEPEPAPVPEPAKPEFNFIGTASLSEGGPALDEKGMRWELRPMDAAGKVQKKSAASGYGAQYEASVPAGQYELQTRLGKIIITRKLTLSDDETNMTNVVFNAGIVDVTARRTPGGEVEKKIRVGVENGAFKAGTYGTGQFYVPAGKVMLDGRLGKATSSQSFDLTAGERVQKDVIVGSGVVVVTALYAEGGPEVETKSIRYSVQENKKNLQGKRKEIAGTYGSSPMEIPVGEYVVGARLDKVTVLMSQPIEVKAGERTDVQVVLDAGVGAITAPGARRISLLGKKNLQGKGKEIAGTYGGEWTLTLPVGEYLVHVTYEGDRAPQETVMKIAAGERTEITLE